MTFKELMLKHLEAQGRGPEGAPSSSHKMLCFDPGNTTGIAYFEGMELKHVEQIRTNTIAEGTDRFEELLSYYKPTVVVVEDYRIYSWKRDDHAWSELHTAKLVGLLESFCHTKFILYINQTGHQAKTFCPDNKLQEWGLYVQGKKHARDAIRHGCYYLLFGKVERRSKKGGQVG